MMVGGDRPLHLSLRYAGVAVPRHLQEFASFFQNDSMTRKPVVPDSCLPGRRGYYTADATPTATAAPVTTALAAAPYSDASAASACTSPAIRSMIAGGIGYPVCHSDCISNIGRKTFASAAMNSSVIRMTNVLPFLWSLAKRSSACVFTLSRVSAGLPAGAAGPQAQNFNQGADRKFRPTRLLCAPRKVPMLAVAGGAPEAHQGTAGQSASQATTPPPPASAP